MKSTLAILIVAFVAGAFAASLSDAQGQHQHHDADGSNFNATESRNSTLLGIIDKLKDKVSNWLSNHFGKGKTTEAPVEITTLSVTDVPIGSTTEGVSEGTAESTTLAVLEGLVSSSTDAISEVPTETDKPAAPEGPTDSTTQGVSEVPAETDKPAAPVKA